MESVSETAQSVQAVQFWTVLNVLYYAWQYTQYSTLCLLPLGPGGLKYTSKVQLPLGCLTKPQILIHLRSENKLRKPLK